VIRGSEIAAKIRALAARLPRRQSPPYELTSWIFLRVLGVIYLIAFISLGTQILGLVGGGGILPAADYLRVLSQYLGRSRFWMAPSLYWFFPNDAGLLFLCYGGAGLAVLLICDVAPALTLFLTWFFYLSLSAICRDFMMFQWDILLLETGFLAIFLSPLRFLPQGPRGPGPESTVVWLMRWLLFRLVFGSGVVKLMSGDLAWRHLTALTCHYQTQPLPTWVGWYAHQLPVLFQKASCFIVFIMELIVPFLFLAPRRFRQAGAALTVGFQILIMLTGNYCFFNLITIALCLLLLDDACRPVSYLRGFFGGGRSSGWRWPKGVVAPMAALILILSGVEWAGTFQIYAAWMKPSVGLAQALSPLRLVNGYGLFAVMTTTRPEIIVEGSDDGQTWLPYEFKYKPGDLSRKPAFVEPHQPRLDWQMWFAALGSYRQNIWFISFCSHLLRGSPDVLALLKKNPFPAAPPHYIRALVYDYCFNSIETRKATGHWWSRQLKGFYCPVLALRQETPASPPSGLRTVPQESP
jgi:hypothetical protein